MWCNVKDDIIQVLASSGWWVLAMPFAVLAMPFAFSPSLTSVRMLVTVQPWQLQSHTTMECVHYMMTHPSKAAQHILHT
jgi:hypothetical protein